MTKKSALILGCNGQDGSLMTHFLLKRGYQVIGITRSEQKEHKNLIKLGIQKDIKIIQADITNFESIYRTIDYYQPSQIYNLAGQTSVGKSFSEPINTINSIVNGTINILEAARKLSFDGSMFFAGSSEIFGNTLKAAKVDNHHYPSSPYAIGKQSSFNLVKTYREVHKLKCSTGILFSHESHLREAHFVTQKIVSGAIECSKNKAHKINLGNLDIARDWGWAEEYVKAMFLMLENNIVKDQVICTGKSTEIKSFIEICFKYFDLNWKDHVVCDDKLFRSNDIKISYGDPQSIYQDLGWKAKIGIEDLIEKLIKYKICEAKNY